MLLRRGRHPAVITNNIFTREDAEHARESRRGVFDANRIQ